MQKILATPVDVGSSWFTKPILSSKTYGDGRLSLSSDHFKILWIKYTRSLNSSRSLPFKINLASIRRKLGTLLLSFLFMFPISIILQLLHYLVALWFLVPMLLQLPLPRLSLIYECLLELLLHRLNTFFYLRLLSVKIQELFTFVFKTLFHFFLDVAHVHHLMLYFGDACCPIFVEKRQQWQTWSLYVCILISNQIAK